MTIKVAINGYGRIGRNVLRAHYEDGKKHDLRIVAVNDLGSPETNAHLTRYDTAHGKFPGKVAVEGDSMIVNGDRIRVLAQRDPSQLPWRDLGVDVVLESTGFFTTKEKASAHLKGGAKKVIISAPGGKDVDATVVYGVNHQTLKASYTVISNASCTTNCFVPMIKVLDDAFGVERGLMTTVHAYTNDQNLLDLVHKDLRRSRAAAVNIVPASTGAARATSLVLESMKGRLDGQALRVPVPDGSITDFTGILAKDVTVEQLRVVSLHKTRALDDLVRKHWGNVRPGTPEEKLAEMRRLSNDLRAGAGSPVAGRELFRKHCATCHKLFGEGEAVGPDLTHANRKDREYLLASVVDPSAVIRKEYLAYNVQTTDGRFVTGLIAEQTPGAVTLLDAKNQRTKVARDRIESMQESPVSLMPENILKGLKPQELRDLFSYLQSDNPPGK